MRRREFITLIGGAAAWPLAARGQQPGRLPTIGYMGQGTQAAEAKRVAAFTGRLRELSWMEGRTVIIDYRWTEGRSDLAADIAGEFARRKVDIIVTSGTPLIAAAKQVTTSIPIVFTAAGDPVGSGLVASLARPGGNVTGLSVLATDLASKRLDLLRQLVQAGLSACRSSPRKFGEYRISRPPSMRSRETRTHFMSVKICSRSATGIASTH
jgi:putative ABC transport system substrate-binding protein